MAKAFSYKAMAIDSKECGKMESYRKLSSKRDMERYMRGTSSRECDMAKAFFRSTEINI